MNLGVQYYRAPFPVSSRWEDDMKKIRESGLNTVQLWVSWGWVEAHPDKFVYDDYDRLVELAGKYGLGVILSTIAEIQPNWIHRVVPGSEMITHMGEKVVSTARCEHHFGITPGGCTDNPEVWRRMKRFIQETGRRYAGLDNLRGWDIWNELRWNVQADGIVCYCPHTLAKYRLWLHRKFGSLDGLNEAWKRRYDCWEDVMPGKLPDRPYTELMSFQHFITEKCNEHAKMRYEAMREVDKVHVITAHGAAPCSDFCGGGHEHALNRGNDWALNDHLDGIGCSSFPQWGKVDDAAFGVRIDQVKSAANGKKVWLSELQGGRAAIGFNIYGKVFADHQQRWVWNGLGSGADMIIFWCWRDEVFGRESAGFGLNGNDGLAAERLAAMKISGDLLEREADLFDHYVPNRSKLGIMFSPQSYYLAWAQNGNAGVMRNDMFGYSRALTKHSIPLVFVEEEHLDVLKNLKLLFLPRTIVMDAKQEDALTEFVANGGTLVVESECGAFDSKGFYRYPEERFLSRFGLVEAGRRQLEKTPEVFTFNGRDYSLALTQWVTPLAGGDYDGKLFAVAPYGKGKVVYLGSYLGNPYMDAYNQDFEDFLCALADEAGIVPEASVVTPQAGETDFVYLKYGKSRDRSVMFAFFPKGLESAEIKLSGDLFPSGKATELLSNTPYTLPTEGERVFTLKPGRFNIAVLAD